MTDHEVPGIIISPETPPQLDDTWSAALEHLGGEILTYNVLYNIFLRSPDAIFIVDNLRIVATNNSGSLYFNYHLSELLDGTLEMFVAEEDREAFHAEWAEFMHVPRFRTLNGGKPMAWHKKGGDSIQVLVELTPLIEVMGPRVITRVRHRA